MITAHTYTILGGEGEKTSLPEKMFGVKVQAELLAQARRVFLANQRKSNAKTKTRSEVNKTTAKMYKQKGTGRARHGAYSAPIFVGGGISHGPTGTQNYELKMPAQLKRLALLGALSAKAASKKVVVLSGGDKANGKTKQASEWSNKTGVSGGRMLLVTGPKQEMLAREWRNIEKAEITRGASMNAYQVLISKWVIFTDEALKEAVKTYVD